jgi:peptidoglycan/xylan/chitin deacetylase (PgdA/CDA1 family)
MKEKSSSKTRAMQIAARCLKLVDGFPFKQMYGGIGQILAFHRVIPENNRQRIWSNSYLEVTTGYLEKVILYYRSHHFDFLSMDDLVLKGFNAKNKFVVFTFDDGFRDNLYHALPLLQKYNVPLNIYICTDFPDKKTILWWNVVEDVILQNKDLSFEWFGEKMEFRCSSSAEKNETFGRIHNLIQGGSELTIKDRALLFCKIFNTDPYNSINELALSWEEIRQMSRDKIITIGAHSVSHPVLSQLSEEDSLEEIRQSKLRIENETGIDLKHFAYPFGGIKEASIREYEMAAACGYDTAVTLVSASIFREHKQKLFKLPRIAVGLSMNEETFDLMRFGVIQMMRN